jgi:plastocyanin domain-containing protein
MILTCINRAGETRTMSVNEEISNKFLVTIRGCGLCPFVLAWAMDWCTRATTKLAALTSRIHQSLCYIRHSL